MNKINHLRNHILQRVSTLQKSPERLIIFIENGSIDFSAGNNLSHKYHFPARLVITDWHESVDLIILPILEWLRAYEPGFNPSEIIRFDAEILNHEKVDLSLTINLTELVIVKKSCDESAYQVEHKIPAPPVDMECDASLSIKIVGPLGEFTLPGAST